MEWCYSTAEKLLPTHHVVAEVAVIVVVLGTLSGQVTFAITGMGQLALPIIAMAQRAVRFLLIVYGELKLLTVAVEYRKVAIAVQILPVSKRLIL